MVQIMTLKFGKNLRCSVLIGLLNGKEALLASFLRGVVITLMGHRCAGEWVTIEVMKVSLDFLANRMDYEVPDQDLSFSMVSIPSIPHSKVVIKNVKRRI